MFNLLLAILLLERALQNKELSWALVLNHTPKGTLRSTINDFAGQCTRNTQALVKDVQKTSRWNDRKQNVKSYFLATFEPRSEVFDFVYQFPEQALCNLDHVVRKNKHYAVLETLGEIKSLAGMLVTPFQMWAGRIVFAQQFGSMNDI